MMRLVALVHLAQGASPERVSALETALAKLADDVSTVRHSHLGRHFPGGRGGGEYTWDVVVDGDDPRVALEAKALEFGEGTSELHRKLIAEHVLGMRKQ